MQLHLEHKIRARAHEIWEQSGRVEGQAERHWWLAEREVLERGPAHPAGEAAAPQASTAAAAKPRAKAKTPKAPSPRKAKPALA